MNSIDLLQMAVKNLMRRKMRTFLTILGVIIGTGAIILMLSLGIGMTAAMKQSIMEMGSINIITVYSSGGYGGYYSEDMSTSTTSDMQLDDMAVQSFASLPGVEAVTPYLSRYWKIYTKKYAVDAEIVGIDPTAMQKMNFELSDGRLLEATDKLDLVIGSEVKNMFYDIRSNNMHSHDENGVDIDLLQEKLKLTYDMSYGQRNSNSADSDQKPAEPYKVNAVGILQEGNWEQAYSVYIPLEQMQEIIEAEQRWQKQGNDYGSRNNGNNTNEYEQVKVKVADINDVEQVQQSINDMGYQTQSLNDILESSKKSMAVTQAILGGIGAVSLLIAAIGITNTMVMSIYERTREIGIMKVIGASLRDIRRLFLLEAALIGLGGGAIGLGVSYLGSWLINYIFVQQASHMGTEGFSQISLIPWWLALMAVAFTSLIGLIAGYLPAVRATKLSALEALRTV